MGLHIFESFSVRVAISIMIAIVLLWIIFRFRKKKSDGGSLEILKKRLEKGEITQEEYEQAKKKQGK